MVLAIRWYKLGSIAALSWLAPSRTGPRYQGIANTIVQLIRRSTWGVVAALRPIRSEEGAAKNLAKYLKKKKRMAKTCRKRPGNLTRITDA
jgi:hypothetical protein